MQQQHWNRWSTIAWSIPEAHLRYAGHNFFSGVIFGLRFLGQTWKKALWGLARRSEPLSARLTRNTSLASRRLTRRTVLHEASAILHGATAAAAQHRPQPFQAVKLRSPAVVQPLGAEDFYHGRSRIGMRIKGRQNKERNNGNGSSTTGTGKMEKGKIQTQIGKNREKSG